MPLAWHYTNNGGLSVGVMGWTALRFGPDIHFYQSMNLLTLWSPDFPSSVTSRLEYLAFKEGLQTYWMDCYEIGSRYSWIQYNKSYYCYH